LYTLVGHVGDGNFHIVIMLDENSPQELHIAEEANARLVTRALSMEGTVTGEHGIGLGKIPYMLYEHGPDAVRLMRSLKVAVDTKNIMNPGKVFPTEEEIIAFESSPGVRKELSQNLVKHEVATAGL
jgi:D-lactate dehydrogenase (cytochrome)